MSDYEESNEYKKNDESESESYISPDLYITVYGGKEREVKDSIEKNLGSDIHYYQTWVTLAVLKRLGFVFEGGVESSGSLTGVICMFITIIAIFVLYFFWQIIIFFVVIGVLALLSGGAALRYLKGTFIEAQTSQIDFSKVETLVLEQISKGSFVKVKSIQPDAKIGPVTKKATEVTDMFRLGIQISLFAATIFLIVQMIYFLLMGHWISGLNVDTARLEILILIEFGLAFLAGILVMDLGVFMRRQLGIKVSEDYSTLIPPQSGVSTV